MIRILKILALILGSLVLQISLVAKMSIFGSRIDLPLVLVVSIALSRGAIYGESVGFVTGILCDLLSGGPMGVQALSKTVIGYGSGLVRRRLYADSFITQLVSGFIATIIAKVINLVHLSLMSNEPRFLKIYFPGLILTGVLNSVLVVAVFRLVRRFIKDET